MSFLCILMIHGCYWATHKLKISLPWILLLFHYVFNKAVFSTKHNVITIHIPNDIEIKEIFEIDLPENWKKFPHPVSTQKIGNDFVSEKLFCVLKIPCVVTQGDYNFLINPNHIDFDRIEVVKMDKFPFDDRIFK